MNVHPIYLDFNATTPVHAEVLEVMLPFFGAAFGIRRVLIRMGFACDPRWRQDGQNWRH